MNSYSPIREEAARLISHASKSSISSISWPSIPTRLVPHRIRRKFRSTRSKIRTRASPTSSVAALETSFSPADTLRALRHHRWSYYDGQYVLLALLGIFSAIVSETPGPLIKMLIASLLMLSFIVPITRQFFLPFLPVATWLVFFRACGFIPSTYRPAIWVKVLPALENIFYGANLSNILAAHKNTFLDVLAWLPYGITHFGAPVVCAALMFVFGPPGTTAIFARTFGYMNIVGVTIQFMFPCSPPWYENMYGLAPANYSMPGSPAGLAAIDKLFGINLYTSTFTASPVVFGAFPSLHAGSATTEVLFMSLVFPKLRPLFFVYLLWLCWATMYLSHHYAVDLAAGALLAGVCFFIAKAKFIPRLQPDKLFRWDYDYVEVGEAATYTEYSYNGVADIHDDVEFRHLNSIGSESDAWSLGSSSAYSNHRHSYSGASGERSPDGGAFGYRFSVEAGAAAGHEDPEAQWEGDTLASSSDDGEVRDAAREKR